MSAPLSPFRYSAVLASLVTATLLTASAQTKVQAPNTRYSLADDVKLGQEAAAEVRKELPLMNDARVDEYIEGIGGRLVTAIPEEFQHKEFKYTFEVVNQKEINAFALPGGPMFLNRGMIEAANSEAEMAGVMAHEISHVALRHGTAQATAGEKYQIGGAIAGAVLEGIFGGRTGAIANQVTQFGVSAYFLKYGREYESQADILGAQLLARAGYDPREMANMFKTIEAQGGGGGIEFLSSHPNPGNRFNAINKEAASLQVQGRGDTGQFAAIQAHLKGAGPSYTAEQIAKGQAKTGASPAPAARTAVRVEPPSTELRTYTPANYLRVSVPSNWSEVDGGEGATYTPEGAYIKGQDGRSAFTHGVQFGVTKGTGNLQQDTQSLLQAFSRSNPNLRSQGRARNDRLGGRTALTASLSNVSEVTGQPEYISLTTAGLPDGNVLYMIGVAPQSEAKTYEEAFRRVRQSVRISTR